MTRLKTIKQAEAALARYIPIARHQTGKDITLDRMRLLMDVLGNPQDNLKIVHIAGTSGKTSTAYYIAGLLQAAGQRVGLTVSPHIDSITERLQIDGRPLAETEFCAALNEFLAIIDGFEPEPSYFELLIGFAYWYFAKLGVDYAVVETGLGGLHDCTNVAHNSGKVCVITDIGLDHMHVLGSSVPQIAAQKAGIIYSGNQVFMYRQAAEVTDVIAAFAAKQGAKLELLDQAELAKAASESRLEELPLYQQRNWLLAKRTADYVADRDGWELPAGQLQKSLEIQVPGRMDKQAAGSKTVVMDGAHNEQKMTAFIRSFQRDYPGAKVPVLLAMKQGKEYKAVLPLLRSITSQMIITTFDVLQDLPNRSIDPAVLAKTARQLGFTDVRTVIDPVEAYRQLLELPDDLAVVTGSFYLLSCIRA